MIRLIIAVILFPPAIALLIRLDRNSDDTGVLVFLISTTAFLLSVIYPRRPWVWALLIATGITAAEVYNFYYGLPRSAPGSVLSIAPVGLFITAVGLLGAYAAVLMRWMIAKS